jgi:hypothetical protein
MSAGIFSTAIHRNLHLRRRLVCLCGDEQQLEFTGRPLWTGGLAPTPAEPKRTKESEGRGPRGTRKGDGIRRKTCMIQMKYTGALQGGQRAAWGSEWWSSSVVSSIYWSKLRSRGKQRQPSSCHHPSLVLPPKSPFNTAKRIIVDLCGVNRALNFLEDEGMVAELSELHDHIGQPLDSRCLLRSSA